LDEEWPGILVAVTLSRIVESVSHKMILNFLILLTQTLAGGVVFIRGANRAVLAFA
jgi:hypothetical protein